MGIIVIISFKERSYGYPIGEDRVRKTVWEIIVEVEVSFVFNFNVGHYKRWVEQRDWVILMVVNAVTMIVRGRGFMSNVVIGTIFTVF